MTEETKVELQEEVVEEVDVTEGAVVEEVKAPEKKEEVKACKHSKFKKYSRNLRYCVIGLLVVFAGYTAWLNQHVKGFVENSKYITATQEKIGIKDFVGNEANVDTIKNGVLRASLFNPNLAAKEFYIEKEIASVGYAYEENGTKYDFGNIIDEPNAPITVKAITKEQFETQASDYHVADEKKYEKVENKEEVQRFLNAIGMPYEDGKTYYKYISGKYSEKYALTVEK